MEKYNFQFCPKLVIFTPDFKSVLLCKRKGESDYDGVFSFAGGKMEKTDDSIVAGIIREKNEEIGENVVLTLFPKISSSILFRKKDGNAMITEHFLAVYEKGEVKLNPEEYSEFKWVSVNSLPSFEPKIPTIPEAVDLFIGLKDKIKDTSFVKI